MRVTQFAAIALLGLPLGGCFMATSQPLPEWAMNPQGQYVEPAATPRKQRAARRTAPVEYSETKDTLVTGDVSATPTASAKPFAPGWDAAESERDASLRRTMTICRGC